MEVDERQAVRNESPVWTVFNNLDLVEKILDGVTDDIRNNMELRLVNKKFRESCHAKLRVSHRDIKIEFIKIYVDSEDPTMDFMSRNRVYINYRRLNIINIDSYFHLIKNIAKVKIQSIIVRDLWKLRPSLQAFLHESISLSLIGNDRDNLKKLIGMNEICLGNRDDCFLIPKECVEYGPLQMDNLRKSFTEPRVFDKLLVPDYLLDDIANSCVKFSNTKDDCFKAISNLIPSTVSCKTLILKISESRKEWIDPERIDIEEMRRVAEPDNQAMPREIIEIMLKKWKVQSVVLKFVRESHREQHAGEWTLKEWFNKLLFKGSRILTKKSDPNLKIGVVLVDLTDSCDCETQLQSGLMFYGSTQNSFYDLYSIIRRVFLNDKLLIQFSHYSSTSSRIFQVVERMMKHINVEAPQNLEVDISIYLKYKNDREYFDLIPNQQPPMRSEVFKNFHISNNPNSINIAHKMIDILNRPSFPFIDKEWIANRCQMINSRRNCIINWTVFSNEQSPDRRRIGDLWYRSLS